MVLDGNQEYLVGEFAELYRAGRMGRREMLRRSLLVTGSVGATAAALRTFGVPAQGAEAATSAAFAERTVFANIAPSDIRAALAGEPGQRTAPPLATSSEPVVAANDPAIIASMVQFPGEAGTVFGYLARPSAAGRYPGIILIHENRGLVEPNLDIARRFAKEGYVTLAVDLISRQGGTQAFAADPMAISGVLGQTTDEQRAADMTAGVEYLKRQSFVNVAAGFGVIGYCFGGGQAFSLAARNPDIRAATPYYGTTTPANLVNTRAAVLAFYGEVDTRTTAQAPEIEAAMAQTGRPYATVIYPDTGHAFFNNTNPSGGGFGYNPVASQDAWRRTLAWFAAHLV